MTAFFSCVFFLLLFFDGDDRFSVFVIFSLPDENDKIYTRYTYIYICTQGIVEKTASEP